MEKSGIQCWNTDGLKNKCYMLWSMLWMKEKFKHSNVPRKINDAV